MLIYNAMTIDSTLITEEFKRRFLETYIRVPENVSAERRDNLQELGWISYMLAGNANIFKTYLRGTNYPEVMVHDQAAFDDGERWYVEEYPARTINLALGDRSANDIDGVLPEIVEAFENYFRSINGSTPDPTSTQHTYGTRQETEADKTTDDANPGFDFRRGHIGIFTYGKRQKFGVRGHGNLWGHIIVSEEDWLFAMHGLAYKGEKYQQEVDWDRTFEMRQQALDFIHKQQWDLLTQPFGDEWDMHDLLRHLCVRAGKSTVDGENETTISQHSWSYYDVSTATARSKLSLSNVLRILDANFFKFPELEVDGVKFIDPAFAKKFLERMGHGNVCYIQIQNSPARRNRLFMVLKGMLQERQFEEVTPINDVYLAFIRVTGGKVTELENKLRMKIKSGKYGSLEGVFAEIYPNNGLTSDQFAILSRLPLRNSNGTISPQPFNKDALVTVLAKKSDSLGKFLRSFRRLTGQTLKEIAVKTGCVKQNISQRELQTFWDDFKLIIKNNHYSLPTDGDDNKKIKPEVMNKIHEINIRALRNLCEGSPDKKDCLTKEQFYIALEESSTPMAFFGEACRQKQRISYRTNTMTHRINFEKNRFLFPLDDEGKPEIEVLTAFYGKFMRDRIEQGTYINRRKV